MKSLVVLLCLCALILSGCNAGPARPDLSKPDTALPANVVASIDSLASEKLAGDPPLPSIVVAVYQAGQPVFVQAYGDFIAADFGRNPTTASPYYFGSVSQTFTAAAIMKLAEEGKLSLDDTVTTFFPDFTGTASQVTIRQLLSHTAGMPDDLTAESAFVVDTSDYISAAERIKIFSDIFANLSTPPGEYSYSNAGYSVLALIVEKVTGMTFPDYLNQELIKPADLESTQVCSSPPNTIVRGFEMQDGELVPVAMKDLRVLPYGSSSMCGTAADLILWHDALRTGLVIKPETYAQMVTLVTPESPLPDTGTGLGMLVSPVTGEAQFTGNAGGIQGHMTSLMYYPQQDLTIALVANTYTQETDILALTSLSEQIRETLAQE